MAEIINSLRSILNKTTRTASRIKPRRVHQVLVSHPRRFNAYKVAGYSFGALTAVILGPIVLWPIADVWLLPNVLSKTLSRTADIEYKNQYNDIWGRDVETSQIEYMMQSLPNNIWCLNGTTNSGKTAFIKKLLCQNKGIIYVDLRHFFDGNAFVFEMVDALYNSNHNSSTTNKLVGCYVKLFCFVTTILSHSDQHITAMLYFHALLNHLKAGITKYNKSISYRNKNDSKQYPLIIFDHFDALHSALHNTNESKNREMLSFIIYSISQFSSSICHDLSLSHVLFVGNQLETQQYGNDNENDKHIKGCMNYLSSSISKHCEYWTIDGINKELAMEHINKQLQKNFNMNNIDNQSLNEIVLKLINCIGTKPYNISVALKSVTSNLSENNKDIISELDTNITNYIEHFNKSQRVKLNKIITDSNHIQKLQTFTNSLQIQTDNHLMEWNEAVKYFDNDENLMVELIENNILSRKHGKKLSSNLNELMQMKLLGKDDSIYVGTMAECCNSLISQS